MKSSKKDIAQMFLAGGAKVCCHLRGFVILSEELWISALQEISRVPSLLLEFLGIRLAALTWERGTCSLCGCSFSPFAEQHKLRNGAGEKGICRLWETL